MRFAGEPRPEAEGGELGARLAEEAGAVLRDTAIVELSYPVGTNDRAVGARLGGLIAAEFGAGPPPGRVRVRLEGSAGQSFGAFLARGAELYLTGDANDYVGKSIGGGRIVISPPADDEGDPVLVGNAALYGATGGKLFCAGRAGERFAVRNSGAVAVVEGTGDHACEYMTNGTVVILGETGRNLGAGMSGGEIFIHDLFGRLPLRLNDELVAAEPVPAARSDELRTLIERHARYTGSARAQSLLDRWADAVREFRLISPRADVAQREDEHDGTVSADAEPAAEAAGVSS
jgi:glutamate synthase domain-containing protein 3